ncbi:differentially expressed in FDCP 6 homolog [Dendropsophus ebraccatus]|uniref:differentially expressed in FDCP 6 homolog n=1 Tax=Dendropsophus ebraccatus TaxID=150705 RepID=UPI0038318F57
MDLLDQFLAGDEENLCLYTRAELEEIFQLLSSHVKSHRQRLHRTKREIQELEAETAHSSLGREVSVSQLAHTVHLLEALEEEEKMQQQLQATTHEMEGLSDARGSESCEALEERLKEVEDLLSTLSQQEKALMEEVRTLKMSLGQSQSALEETAAEHQTVEAALLALQDGVHSAQSPPVQEEATQLLSALIQEMDLLRFIPRKRSN